ncbi:PD-(D/E)XK motif protein [Roseateles sp. L2-2]|uniref:PD-(D/E)XK motif protein n=1 Tax=Roseateles sp. L2-2 TaxID=3422597 RepID=UPI003D362362
MTNPKFEDLLAATIKLVQSTDELNRNVHWFDPKSSIGIARQSTGRVEIFIVGEPLNAASALVRRHLRSDTWTGQNGAAFVANRIVLPSDEHFLASAAFLVEELFRSGVLNSPQHAFKKCEPIFELFLRRSALDEQTIQGLYAELLLLESGFQLASTEAMAARILEGWQGWTQSNRDFVYPNACFEVKSTGGSSSRHAVSGISQVDVRKDELGKPLERLYLISVGLHASELGGGRSLPQIVANIVERLKSLGASGSLKDEFLLRVSKYGSESGQGYIHEEMKDWDAYAGRLSRTFLRIYDMCDPGIRVLRFEDVLQRIHVAEGSVKFEIDLPVTIDGDLNPSSDLRQLIQNAI